MFDLTGLQKSTQHRLYEARANFNIDQNKVSIIEMKKKLMSINKNISFSHLIPDTINFNYKITKFGIQYVGSPSSYQLLLLE